MNVGDDRRDSSHPRATQLLLIVIVAAFVGWTPRSAGAADPPAFETVSVGLANRGAAYDPSRDQLLVLTSDNLSGLGNSIVEVDPHTGALGRTLRLGSRPEVIAVSDDGSRAYVGLTWVAQVVEIDLDTFAPVRSILVSDDPDDIHYAEDIEVMPGTSSVIAVSRRDHPDRSARHEGVAIFEDGVRRPETTTDTGIMHRIEFGADPGVLYGYNNSYLSYPSSVAEVDADGVRILSSETVITGRDVDIEFSNGLIHATNGEVMDPTVPSLLGSYAASGSLAVDENAGIAYFYDKGDLTGHDVTDRSLLWSVTVDEVENNELILAGDVLVAVADSGLLLIGTDVDGSGFALPPVPGPRIHSWDAVVVPQRVERLVADPNRGVVFGVVRSDDLDRPNQVVEIDVESGTITRGLDVGDDPYRLGISDDGGRLYIGHAGANRMTEVDVTTFSVINTVSLPGGGYADDIDPVPGSPDSYIVQFEKLDVSPSKIGILLAIDGVAAPNLVGVGYPTGPTDLSFGGDPTVLYGHNGDDSGAEFFAYAVDSDGLTMSWVLPDLLHGFNLLFAEHDGLLYASNGQVVDPLVPQVVAKSPGSGIPVLLPGVDRVAYLDDELRERLPGSFVEVYEHEVAGHDIATTGSAVIVADDVSVQILPVREEVHLPGAPTDLALAPGDGEVNASWTAPDDGGSPILSYELALNFGADPCVTTQTECLIEGLTNGLPHLFRVRAINGVGHGPWTDWSAATAATTCAVPAPGDGATTGPFLDVAPEHPFCADIEWLVAIGAASGYEDGRFRPTQLSSRQTISALFYRLAYYVEFDPPAEPTFSDVLVAHPFFTEIEWLAYAGISTGYRDGTFRPLIPVTRQTFAAMLHRYAGSPAFTPPATPSFTDVPASHPFFVEIEWLASTGITTGYSDGTFGPTIVVSRQTIAAFLHRFIDAGFFYDPY